MDQLRSVTRRHPVVAFVVVAYALSWAWWIPSWLLAGPVARGDPWPTQLPGLLGPALAAVVVTAAVDGVAGLRDLSARMRRWRVAARWWLLCAGTVLLAWLVVLLTEDAVDWSRAAEYSGTPNLGLLATFLLIWVVNGFGEETGWRGFAVDRLLPRHGLLATAMLVFVAWAGWHIPVLLTMESFRGMGPALLGWLFALACGSVFLTWLYARTGGSVLVVALWHTCFNFASGTALTEGTPAMVVSTVVMAAAAVIAVRSFRAGRAEPASTGEAAPTLARPAK